MFQANWSTLKSTWVSTVVSRLARQRSPSRSRRWPNNRCPVRRTRPVAVQRQRSDHFIDLILRVWGGSEFHAELVPRCSLTVVHYVIVCLLLSVCFKDYLSPGTVCRPGRGMWVVALLPEWNIPKKLIAIPYEVLSVDVWKLFQGVKCR